MDAKTPPHFTRLQGEHFSVPTEWLTWLVGDLLIGWECMPHSSLINIWGRTERACGHEVTCETQGQRWVSCDLVPSIISYIPCPALSPASDPRSLPLLQRASLPPSPPPPRGQAPRPSPGSRSASPLSPSTAFTLSSSPQCTLHTAAKPTVSVPCLGPRAAAHHFHDDGFIPEFSYMAFIIQLWHTLLSFDFTYMEYCISRIVHAYCRQIYITEAHSVNVGHISP